LDVRDGDAMLGTRRPAPRRTGLLRTSHQGPRVTEQCASRALDRLLVRDPVGLPDGVVAAKYGQAGPAPALRMLGTTLRAPSYSDVNALSLGP